MRLVFCFLLVGALWLAAPISAEAEPTTLKIAVEKSMHGFLDPWLDSFQRAHPDVVIERDAGHRPPENRAVIGAGAAELFQRNDREFYARHGYVPLDIAVSSGGRHVIGTIQALGVFVHPNNPLRRLTMEQVEAIFSGAPRGGLPAITHWGQLGLTGAWAERPIAVYGRERRQGASNYFRERSLGGADYCSHYQTCANSTKVVEAVASDEAGIGYSALAYETEQVRAVALAEREGAITGQPTEWDVAALRYPLAYPLFITLHRKSGEPVSAVVRQFFEYALSPAGQALVAANGYLPLPPDVAQAELSKLR